MSFLAELACYLTVRRQLGADLSTDERILRRFATFADRDDVEYVNTNLVMRWLESLPSASPGTRATRFRVARQSGLHLSQLGLFCYFRQLYRSGGFLPRLTGENSGYRSTRRCCSYTFRTALNRARFALITSLHTAPISTP
jgi:hypothetical protein